MTEVIYVVQIINGEDIKSEDIRAFSRMDKAKKYFKYLVKREGWLTDEDKLEDAANFKYFAEDIYSVSIRTVTLDSKLNFLNDNYGTKRNI